MLGRASDLVNFDDERVAPVVELALNRTVVVDDLAGGRRAFEAMQGGFQIVTRNGELIRSGGSVTGGRTNKNGQEGTFLAREREWRELPGQIDEIVKNHESVSTQLADNHSQAAAVKGELQDLTEQHQQLSQQQQETEAVADKMSRAIDQLIANLDWHEELRAKSQTELEQLDSRQQETEQEIEQLEADRQAAETEAQQLAEEVQSLSAETLVAEENQAKSAVAAIEARQQNQQALLESHQAAESQLAAQIDTKKARAESLAAERENLIQQQNDLTTRNDEFESELAALTEKVQTAEKQLAELESQQIQLEHEERNLQQRLQRSEADHNRVALEAARCQDDLDNLQRQIQDDLGLVQLEMSEEQVGQPLLPLQKSLVSDLPLVEELPAGVEEDVKRLKVQIRRLGSINPDAPREYAELKERHQFLTEQINDLEAAVTDLREVIAKLDTAMEEAFTDTFQQVAKEFQRYFRALFGGGEAQLILTDPDNLIDTGVDIVARPPGKRLQSLALLSGGERSLTAQALIFSLLKISPTPFVVFDEVDAMLDEANVGRFREALTKLSEDIQFIIITHNRKTIEAANTLYGISMGDDSVSQVYSLKIDEWLDEKA